jgi:hypothetical protein
MLFPDSVFLIGYDTYARIIDLKYYENSDAKFQETLLIFVK